MKTKIALFLAMAALAAGVRTFAQDTPTHATGKILLLTSERIMEGDVERIGERYRIRRGTSEVWIPADKAICICADHHEAFAQMKSRANLGDADERFRLAKWCMTNNLREQALDEARYALEMRPEHAQTKNLIAILERGLKPKMSAPIPTAAPKAPSRPIVQAPQIDVNAETLSLFTQKIQPILMNTCANCHTDGRGGQFQLYRAGDAGHRAATQRNLAAVLAQLHMQKPALSPLLIKAVSAHGNTQNAPIQSQQGIPYRSLCEWIDRTLATNPHLRERANSAMTASLPESPSTFKTSPTDPLAAVVSRPVARAEVAAAKSKAPNALPKQSGATPLDPSPEPTAIRPASAEQAGPRDPFDPEIFNRQAQPKK
ncbi:MAG: hypothetical protein HY040_25695 [Planctomycetes bacterium]|nr:hypothetical protein [Planctomycetota bacterium]